MRQRVLGEGDLFGVRAIEKGYYGGVAQSAPTTAANSPRLSPASSIYGDGSPIIFNNSAHNSIPEFSLSESGLSASPSNARPSLRLRPSEAELSGRRNHDPTVHAYMPTSPKRVEASAESLPNHETAPRTRTPMDLPQIPSYAQWKLSPAGRSSSNSRSKSGTRMSREASPARGRFPTPPLTPGRRKSRSVSSVDELAHLQMLHEKYLGNGPAMPPRFHTEAARTRFPVKPASTYSSRDSSVDYTARVARSRNRSRDSTVDRTRQTSSDSNKSLRRTRDSAPQQENLGRFRGKATL